jgi:hypothetical protein
MDTAMAAPDRRVDMWFEDTAPQNRWTVGFRLILLIPQVIVLLFLWLATVVVAIIGWFAALFTGRLPEFAHTFIAGVLRWSTRVNAYAFLLTDAYPPFAFDDEAYPARPIFPARGPLNRWAVFFRWVLVVPASVFAQIVARGLTLPLLVVAWFIVLISGRMPPQLYWAYASLVRYETRMYGYFLMLTSEYAWGMLGDPALAAPPATAPFGAPASAPPPPPPPPVDAEVEAAAPSPLPADADAATDDATAAPPPSPPQWPPPVPPPPPPSGIGAMPPPSPWERAAPAAGAPAGEPGPGTLILTGAARGWMIFAIVWGAVLTVAQGPIQAAIARNNNTQTATQQFDTSRADVNEVSVAILASAEAARTCTSIASVRPSSQAAAAKLTHLANDLRAMSLPDNATASATAVESDADQLASIYNELAASKGCADYHTLGQTSAYGSVLASYLSDSVRFLTVLQADQTT